VRRGRGGGARGPRGPPLVGIAKLYANEAAVECSNLAIQVHGGADYVDDHPVERYFRDVRVTTLYEGTSQIQKLIIGGATTGINVLVLSGERRAATSHACYSEVVAREITQRELRNDSGAIMRELDRGESFVVTRNGVPVGKLSPIQRRRFVAVAPAVGAFATAARIDPARFRADLDRELDQDAAPRA